MISLSYPVLYCAKCDTYYPFSEGIRTCPSCGNVLWKVAGIMRSERLEKKFYTYSMWDSLLGIKYTCSFCKSNPIFQCIFENQGRKYTSFCCSEHARVCMCWKLGGFSHDLTGEISNPLEILNIIQNATSAKAEIVTQIKIEDKKIIEYLNKLEELHKQGQISDKAYFKLKDEYEKRLKRIEEESQGTIVKGEI